jgi:regulatory protein
MRITAITPQKRNPSRRNIFVDGVFAVGVSAETLIRFALRTGDEISADLLEQIERIEELVSAKAVALRYLGVRPRTEKEIRDKLRDKEFGDEEIQKALESLREARLVDDADFARMYIRDQMQRRPSGALALRRKLLLLGVDKDTVEAALRERPGGKDDHAQALKAARGFVRKARSLRPGEPEDKVRKRAAAFLARRGFSWDVIQSVCKSLFSGTTGDGNEFLDE